MMYIRSLLVASVAFSSCLFALSSLADEQNLSLEEIVVTARKQEESAQDVPVAITALTAELENSTIRSLRDLDGYAPNLSFGVDGNRGGGGANVTIRGLSPTRSDDNSFDSPVAIVIDDIYLGSMAGAVIESFDLERVEVLRGPQGTLFGKNTVAGVINVIRSKPTGETGGKVKITAGKDGQQEIRGVFNFGLSDTLAMKVFATDIQFDGHMDNITTGRGVAEKSYQNFGAKFLFEPNDRFTADLTIERFQDDGTLDSNQTNYNTAPGVLPQPPAGSPENDYSGGFATCTIGALLFGVDGCRPGIETPGVSVNDKDNVYDIETDALTLKMTYELNDNISLVSITGYRDMLEYRLYDFDASAVPFITIERDNDYEQFSQELRLDGQWDNVTLSAGLYYFNNDFEQDWVTGDGFWGFVFGTFGIGPASDPAAWGLCQSGILGALSCDPGVNSVAGNVTQILYEQQETTSYAAYAQMDYRFAEQWVLTAGLRYTREEKDFIAGQAYLTNEARAYDRAFPGGYADLEQSWNETSPKIGLRYEINDDSMVYVSYAEGFKSGGFFGVNQNIADFVRDQYDPEFAHTIELGYKSQWMENRLRFNAIYFRNEFDDKQEQSVKLDPSTNTVATVFDNAASAIYQGIELEAQYVFSENFRAFATLGTLDAEYDEFFTDINPNDGVDIVVDASYLNPRGAPEYTWSVGGTLTLPVETGDIEVFTKFTKIAEVDGSLLNLTQSKVGAREDLSMSIGYYTENWSVAAFGRNLTDERFEVFFPIATLFAAGAVNRPRSYGMEFTYEF